MRGATPTQSSTGTPRPFQSTHPVRGATNGQTYANAQQAISIHAPREGCDAAIIASSNTATIFQSTHPVRGATREVSRHFPDSGISIHAPREGCDQAGHPPHPNGQISIHAPREGCDLACFRTSTLMRGFQSTHPVRGATYSLYAALGIFPISIHAPREGCDGDQRRGEIPLGNFNPRTP